jgi:hypothetical protein
MKRSEIIDYIKSHTPKFEFGNLATYETLPVSGDLADTDIPAWGNVKNNVLTLDVIPAGTWIPFFIDISLFTSVNATAEIITKATAYDPYTGLATGQLKRYYDMDVIDQDTNSDGTGTFTGWNVYGHNDGTGKFLEDTTIILKA